MPNSLDIDMERQELCWTDAGSQSKQTKSKIEVMPKIGKLTHLHINYVTLFVNIVTLD
jgi:hypothetical protein